MWGTQQELLQLRQLWGERRRRCWFFCSLGCDKSHPAYTYMLLKKLEPEAKKRPWKTAGCAFSA
jgi:hypothetical protein